MKLGALPYGDSKNFSRRRTNGVCQFQKFAQQTYTDEGFVENLTRQPNTHNQEQTPASSTHISCRTKTHTRWVTNIRAGTGEMCTLRSSMAFSTSARVRVSPLCSFCSTATAKVSRARAKLYQSCRLLGDMCSALSNTCMQSLYWRASK